jgi:thioredoxin 1
VTETETLADPELETMRPNPTWDAASYEDVVEAFAEADVHYHVWAGDWCGDCRKQLPDFAATLAAAEVPDDRIHLHPVERGEDGKVGELVEEYDIELIPTVVVEDTSGEELARFVEREPLPVGPYLAERLANDD